MFLNFFCPKLWSSNPGERALPYTQPDRQVLDLPNPEEWKAEFILVLVIYQRQSTVQIYCFLQMCRCIAN